MTSKNHNQYPIHQSPLFKLKGKGKFEKILGIKWEDVITLSTPNFYMVWKNKNGREIQAPISTLKQLHKKLSHLLEKIEIPDYLYSQKGRSYVDNAYQHIGNIPVIKTDIHHFYPSISREMVFKTFSNLFKCSSDIADKLSRIICFDGKFLPTGSALSGRVAFFVAQEMFEKIHEIACQNQCKLTVYVDDIAISGFGATPKLLSDIRRLIKTYGFTTKNSKSKYHQAHTPKIITGVAITGEELKLPNARHKKIHDARKLLQKTKANTTPEDKTKLIARLCEADQILNYEANKNKKHHEHFDT